MNPVKNQGHCGSCWAFGAIGILEAAWYLAGNDKVVLSEQMLVDCGPGYGCDGGWTDYALDFLIESGGAQAEADYPYTAGVDEVAGLNFGVKNYTLFEIFIFCPKIQL